MGRSCPLRPTISVSRSLRDLALLVFAFSICCTGRASFGYVCEMTMLCQLCLINSVTALGGTYVARAIGKELT